MEAFWNVVIIYQMQMFYFSLKKQWHYLGWDNNHEIHL